MSPRTIRWALAAVLSAPLLYPVIAFLPYPLYAAGLPEPAVMLEAVMAVGPGASACLSRGERRDEYTPSLRRLPWRVFDPEPAEDAAAKALRGPIDATDARPAEVVVERVSVSLHPLGLVPADARVRVRRADGTIERYVVQLRSRGAHTVSLDMPTREVMLCTTPAGGWTVEAVSPL
jgi:hypothetical protein